MGQKGAKDGTDQQENLDYYNVKSSDIGNTRNSRKMSVVTCENSHRPGLTVVTYP